MQSVSQSIFFVLLVLACRLFPTTVSYYVRQTSLVRSCSLNSAPSPIDKAMNRLMKFDSEYINRMKLAKASNITMKELEFKRAQELTVVGLQQEREEISSAMRIVSANAPAVILGIKAERGLKAIDVLRAWVGSLSLPRGVLRAGE